MLPSFYAREMMRLLAGDEHASVRTDQGLIVRSKIAEINDLDGPENVMLGNGSIETCI